MSGRDDCKKDLNRELFDQSRNYARMKNYCANIIFLKKHEFTSFATSKNNNISLQMCNFCTAYIFQLRIAAHSQSGITAFKPY